MRENIKLVCFAFFWVIWGALLTWCLTKCGAVSTKDNPITEEVKRDTVFLTDTIIEIEPIPVSIVSTEIRNRKLPVAKPDTVYLNSPESSTPKDSIEVEVPITQAEYKSVDYHAWISGFEARLDSIRIFKQTEFITVEKLVKHKIKHWHLGPMMGVGITPRGLDPFIGIGISYSIISF